jgi:polysaccharide biosynthesis transport protein
MLNPHEFSRPEPFFEPPSDSLKSLRHYVRIIVEKKLAFLATFLLILCGSLIFGFTRTPQYRSTASLRIELGSPTVRGMGGPGDFQTDFNMFYETQIQALKDMAESGTIPGLMSLGAGGESKTATPNPKPPWANLQVMSDRGSRLINLQMTADDPFLARDRLRRYIEEYKEEDRRKLEEITSASLAKLGTEVKQAEAQMLKSQKELVDFCKVNGKVFADKNTDLSTTFLENASKRLIETRNELMDLETLALHKRMILPRNIDNQYLRRLRENSASLKAEYISASHTFGPGYFKLSLYENKIYAMEKAIADLEKSEFGNTLEAAKRKESAAWNTFEGLKQEAIKSGSLALHFAVLKKAADADAQVYFSLCEKAKNASLFSRLALHSVSVENPPSLPSTPVSPDWKKIIAAGLLLGLAAGLSVVLGREIWDNKIRSSEELKARLNLPVLGVVPNVKLVMPRGLESVSDIRSEFMPYQFPVSPFTDAIRIVREAIAGMLEREAGAVLSVTSALPGEGKTFISLALASAIVSERKRVVVIDADLRNPRIGRALRVPSDQPGLTNVLTGAIERIHEVIHESHVPGLYYVMSGPIPENPVALLKSQAMRDSIEACSKSFDLIIVDCPPVLGFADALILGGYADGVLLVVRQDNESLEPAKSAREALIRADTPLLGTVFNLAERGDGDLGWFTSKGYSRDYHSRYYDQTPHPPPV